MVILNTKQCQQAPRRPSVSNSQCYCGRKFGLFLIKAEDVRGRANETGKGKLPFLQRANAPEKWIWGTS